MRQHFYLIAFNVDLDHMREGYATVLCQYITIYDRCMIGGLYLDTVFYVWVCHSDATLPGGKHKHNPRAVVTVLIVNPDNATIVTHTIGA